MYRTMMKVCIQTWEEIAAHILTVKLMCEKPKNLSKMKGETDRLKINAGIRVRVFGYMF